MKRTYIAAAILACTATSSAIAADQVLVVPMKSSAEVQAAPVMIQSVPSGQVVAGSKVLIVPMQSTVQSTQAFENDPIAVREIQQELTLRGYPTFINGVWNAHNETALQYFQRANGIVPSGHVNAQTLAAMGYTVVSSSSY